MCIALLAAFAVVASGMTRAPAWMLAIAALLYGAGLAKRGLAMPALELVWDRRSGALLIDGTAAHAPTLRWRGLCAFLRWRDAQGGVHRRAWWPDTLDAQARRELRLAAWRDADAAAPASMAP